MRVEGREEERERGGGKAEAARAERESAKLPSRQGLEGAWAQDRQAMAARSVVAAQAGRPPPRLESTRLG
jgi:hypothetical protein